MKDIKIYPSRNKMPKTKKNILGVISIRLNTGGKKISEFSSRLTDIIENVKKKRDLKINEQIICELLG